MVLKTIPIGVGLPIAEGVKFINDAIEAAEQAKIDSTTAISTANTAKNSAEQTRTELDQAILSGDSSPLAGQLSVGSDAVTYPSAQERFLQEYQGVSSQLAENATVGYSFLNLLESGQVTGIKLIGDSITVGVGGGGAEDLSRALIGTTGIHEANITSRVWANFLREYVAVNYPSISFFNAGIGGWSATNEGLTYGTEWYGTSNDFCFVMLGTNDRGDATTELEFETNIETFVKGVEANSNNLIVMTAPPTNNDYDSAGVKGAGLNLTMEQIDKVIARVCVKNGWEHISFYRKFLEYQMNSEIPLDDLLETNGGSHPISSGYLLMWKIQQLELGLVVNTYDWRTNSVDLKVMKSISESGSFILSTTPITSFRKNYITYHAIATNHSDVANYPMGLSGILKTVRTYNDSYSYQEYIVFDKGWSFKRYRYNITWRAWVIESQVTGNTANRPTNPLTGMMYYDQTLAKPIYYLSGVWKDATGTNV